MIMKWTRKECQPARVYRDYCSIMLRLASEFDFVSRIPRARYFPTIRPKLYTLYPTDAFIQSGAIAVALRGTTPDLHISSHETVSNMKTKTHACAGVGCIQLHQLVSSCFIAYRSQQWHSTSYWYLTRWLTWIELSIVWWHKMRVFYRRLIVKSSYDRSFRWMQTYTS